MGLFSNLFGNKVSKAKKEIENLVELACSNPKRFFGDKYAEYKLADRSEKSEIERDIFLEYLSNCDIEYNNLSRNDKNQIMYFIGQAQAKILLHSTNK